MAKTFVEIVEYFLVMICARWTTYANSRCSRSRLVTSSLKKGSLPPARQYLDHDLRLNQVGYAMVTFELALEYVRCCPEVLG